MRFGKQRREPKLEKICSSTVQMINLSTDQHLFDHFGDADLYAVLHKVFLKRIIPGVG
jgi:hypothetical protein